MGYRLSCPTRSRPWKDFIGNLEPGLWGPELGTGTGLDIGPRFLGSVRRTASSVLTPDFMRKAGEAGRKDGRVDG